MIVGNEEEGLSTDNPVDQVRGLDRDRVWDYENGFYWFSDTSRIGKLLAHERLYQKILNLPGDIVELGVYKGCSLIRLATFRSIFEHESSRRLIGFDAFGKFPSDRIEDQADLDFVQRFENAGGDGLTKDELESLLSRKKIGNTRLIAGDVFDSVPAFLQSEPAARIALLHLDMDVQEPTAMALETLYDRVVPGGLIVFDDYTAVAGATEAVDTFLEKHHLCLQKMPFYLAPSYVVKS